MKIFVNGSFDVLHAGHIQLLNYAKGLGTHLLVAIDSDERIASLKGASRPFNALSNRKLIMENLKPVDSVSVFSSDEELVAIIKQYSPDIMVKGSDWRGKKIVGAEFCRRTIFYDRIINESTTKILNNFLDNKRE